MGWETRGGRQYYYSKRRRGGRVVSRYVPASIAALAAQLDTVTQAEREAERVARRSERAELAQLAGTGADLETIARALVRLALLDAGYHQHKGQWRKRRNGQPK
jgi:hypothetical protein